MDLRGNIQEITFSNIGEPILRIKLNRTARVNDVINYEENEPVKLKITKAGNSRTLEQNNLLWAIISDIDKGLNAIPTETGRWDIYTIGIEELGVEYEDYKLPRQSVDMVRKAFRKCRVIEEYGNDVVLRCFVGSSKFNKKQMGELIDWFIRYAGKMQIPIRDYIDDWKYLFEEKKKKIRS